jgi:hypothetical protein
VLLLHLHLLSVPLQGLQAPAVLLLLVLVLSLQLVLVQQLRLG